MLKERFYFAENFKESFEKNLVQLLPGQAQEGAALTDYQRALWGALAKRGLETAEIAASVAEWPVKERLQFHGDMNRLLRDGYILETVEVGGNPLATRRIISPHFQKLKIPKNQTRQLSRFAYARHEKNGLTLESPRCHAQIIFHDWQGAALLAHWSGGELPPAFSKPIQEALETFVAESGFLELQEADGKTQESQDEVLRQWEFHDLLFHARSRPGRHNNPMGGTFHFRGEIAELPRAKAAMSQEIIPLTAPDLTAMGAQELPFSQILDNRRSKRTEREPGLTLEELSGFLYRSARALPNPINDGKNLRPSPTGGARNELEIYVLNNRCHDLREGLYHYDAHHHALEKIEAELPVLRPILKLAMFATGVEDPPPVLLLITARFQRVSWKYSSIAYSLILKNVGCLFQTMYLVATAMGLNPCAIGAGNSDLFARATGIPYEVEGPVGEFALW